ncbi:MAG TPA: dienelactone hydrolase family protein [Chloroflexota bacterium]|nr:dienelactone hydrolase family protein [Chloroflexota bacterium]
MNDMQQYLVDEFVEEYRLGRMTRREVLRRVTLLTGSAVAAGTLVNAVTPLRAAAEPSPGPLLQWTPQVSPFDPSVRAGEVIVPGDGVPLSGYIARPADGATHPGVLVIHENRGLSAHYEDVTRRLAKAGYAALVVDLLSRVGGVGAFADDAEAAAAQAQIAPEQHVRDLNAAASYLGSQPYVNGDRVGVMGFCFGGGMTWRVAMSNPSLRAGVPYYGPIPPMDDLSNLQAAMLAIYGGEDANVNSRIPDMEAAMQAAGKTFEVVIEPDAPHAFFNESAGSYTPAAAADAWGRTLDWFGRYLSS